MSSYLSETKFLWIRIRMIFLCALVCVCSGLLVYKAYLVQVKNRNEAQEEIEAKYREDFTSVSLRGRILDLRGDVLASSEATTSFWINPTKIDLSQSKTKGLLKEIASLTEQDPLALEEAIRNSTTTRYWVAQNLGIQQSRKVLLFVRKEAISWLHSRREPLRHYPKGRSSVLGSVGLVFQDPYEQNILEKGTTGLESYYQNKLDAPKVVIPTLRSRVAGSIVLPLDDTSSILSTGSDLHTAIDPVIQNIVDEELKEGVKNTRSAAGAALVMDPYTGEILAIKTVFSDNKQNKSDWPKDFCITGAIQPGSVMKIVSLGAAIEDGVVRKTDSCYRKSGVTINGKRFHDEDSRIDEDPDLTIEQTLARSSNVCTVKTTAKLGTDGKELYAFYKKLGFGQKTGVDFLGESPGLLPPVRSWHSDTYASMSYGYGLTITPLQLAAAVSVYANGGIVNTPHFARKVTDQDGKVIFEPSIKHVPVVKPSTARTIREMMYAVTQKYGTAQHVKIPGFNYAGKTGTAWKVKGGHYDKESVTATFAGFFPYENPAVTIVVVLDDPGVTDHKAAQVSAPIFAKIAGRVAKWRGMNPVESLEEDSSSKKNDQKTYDKVGLACSPLKGLIGPDFCDMTLSQAMNISSKEGLVIKTKGDIRGQVVSQKSIGPKQVELTFDME